MNTTQENVMIGRFSFVVAVNERFPDGSRAIHYFDDRDKANLAVEAATLRNPDRTYEIRELA